MRLRESRQDHPPRARVNDARCRNDPRCLPSKQGPSPRNALSSARLRTWSAWRLGRRPADHRRLFTPADPFGSSRARLPSTRPVASGGRASLSLGVACRLLQPLYRRAGTPDERSTLAREWGFRPATRRHQPMPVALAPWCVAAPGTCEPPSAHAGLRATRSTCVDETDSGPRRSSKGRRAVLDDSRVPSS